MFPQGRSDGGISVYTPKSVTVLFTCGTLTHVLKLQWVYVLTSVKTYTPQIKFLATLLLPNIFPRRLHLNSDSLGN